MFIHGQEAAPRLRRELNNPMTERRGLDMPRTAGQPALTRPRVSELGTGRRLEMRTMIFHYLRREEKKKKKKKERVHPQSRRQSGCVSTRGPLKNLILQILPRKRSA